MEKELVPYEQSLQLKELGFEELCFGYFDCERDFQFVSNKKKFLICEVARPTFSQAFRWFREKYKLHIEIRSYTARFFTIVIQECKDIVKYIEYGGINLKFNTYEEAELACLNKLIEIVKENGK